MITATSMVKKSPQFTCTRCGLKAAAPMVVPSGVCSNYAAWSRRVRIAQLRKAKP